MPVITRGLAANPPCVPCGKSKMRIFDDRLKSFFMEVRATGVVTFYVRYRDTRNRQREIRLGRLGEVTVDQARKRAQELRAEASLGGDPAGERDRLRAVPSFADYMERIYLPSAKERLRSYRDQESFYRLRLKGAWGSKRLDEVRPADVAAFQARLRDEGLSNSSVNRYTALIRAAFNQALRHEIFEGKNPARNAEMRREQHRERYLTEAQILALLRSLDVEASRTGACAIALLAATGARRGEALGAKWEHIDFERRLWTIPLSKSGRRRHIPLSDAAVRILGRLDRIEGSPWLFPGVNPAKPIYDLKKLWERVKARAGIEPDFRIHDLRHTFASTLVGKGRSLYEVGELLGHSQVSMTMRYAHLAPARLIEAANLALPNIG